MDNIANHILYKILEGLEGLSNKGEFAKGYRKPRMT